MTIYTKEGTFVCYGTARIKDGVASFTAYIHKGEPKPVRIEVSKIIEVAS